MPTPEEEPNNLPMPYSKGNSPTVPDMGKDYFLKTMQETLDHASHGPASHLVDSVTHAQGVLSILDRVEKGEISVQPRPTQEDIEPIHREALAIIGMGQRALFALKGSRSSRKAMKKELEKAAGRPLAGSNNGTVAKPVSFVGEGSEVKK